MDQPETPQKTPYVEEVEPANYAWCSCGRSQKQPHCDGAHRGTSFRPVIQKIEEKQKVAWCGCKMTATPPYCDGAHKKL